MEPVPPLSHTESLIEPLHPVKPTLAQAQEMAEGPRQFFSVVSYPLGKNSNLIIKRCLDLAFSSLLILLIFPWFLPLIALFIKMESRGPLFFRQKRFKKNEKIFSCIKLRTMYVNSEADLLAARHDDARITRLGRILRKSHLDELPQLVNVFMGDMSLIGPRPHMVSENLAYAPLIKNYSLRHQVKPGMTGLAQVLGYTGHVTDSKVMEKRVEQDLVYIREWSVLMDIKIIALTLLKLLNLYQGEKNP